MATSSSAVLDVTNPASANGVGTELATTTHQLAERLAVTTITDLASLDQAATDRRQIGDALKQVEAFFEPIKSMAFKLHRAICDRQNTIMAPLLLLDQEKARAIGSFKRAQDELRAQRERDEAQRRRQDEQTRAAAEAAALESANEPELAAAVLAEAIAAPLPTVVLVDETTAVVKFRRTWKWRFTSDEARTLQLLPREFLCIDTIKLNKYAVAMRESGKVPGVTFYFEDTPLR